MSNTLEFEARMKDLMSEQTQKITDSLNKLAEQKKRNNQQASELEKTMKKLAAAYLSFEGVKKLVGFLGDATNAAAKQEDAIVSLTTNLGYYSDSLIKLAEARQKSTKFGDDETESAIGLLATYTKSESQLTTLLPLIQDYATVYKKDLSSASQDVGKALLGNATMMNRLGFNIDGTKSKAERFSQIQQQLKDRVAGAAEQAALFGSGPMEILKNQFGEAAEALGGQLLPYVQEFSQTLIEQMPRIQAVAEFIGKTFVSVFGGVGFIVNQTVAGIFTALEKVTKFVGAKELSNTFKIAAEDAAQSAYNSFKIIVEPWDDATNKAVKRAEELKKIKTFARTDTEGKDKTADDEKKRAEQVLEIRTRLAEDIARLESQKKVAGTTNEFELLKIKFDEEAAIRVAKYQQEYDQLNGNLQAQAMLKQSFDAQQKAAQIAYSQEFQAIEQEQYDAEFNLHKKSTENYIKMQEMKRQKMLAEKDMFIANLRTISTESKLFFNLYKTAAIAQATIDTYKGATAALGAFNILGPVGPVLGAIAAAAHIAAGLANVRQIQQQRFAYGGIVGGNNFTGDKQPVMANSGEMFLNGAQQARLLSIANGNTTHNSVSASSSPQFNFYGSQGGYDREEIKRQLSDDVDGIIYEAIRSNKLQRSLAAMGR